MQWGSLPFVSWSNRTSPLTTKLLYSTSTTTAAAVACRHLLRPPRPPRGWMRGRKMRTICDACESAPAIIFCAADEASLCLTCDEKVHLCNKLASRHARVGLANPSKVPRCNICENAPGFFYSEIDGSYLCLQCDMIVHVGGKRTHGRYLLLRQRFEFPGDKTEQVEVLIRNPAAQSITIDLNTKPVRFQGQASSSSQAQPMDAASDNDREPPCVVPTGPLPGDG